MKIFWCWQSDTDGKTGRHFVREALELAVAKLKEPEDIEEPSELEHREALHLDHGRQGVSGSPELARTIFEKIDQTGVFVADVTVVGAVTPPADADGATTRKKLINPNVAIEYGYAVKAVSDQRILLIQNTAYGGREGLPFDMAHKNGPIQYELAPGASSADIKAAKAKLVGLLVSELRECLVTLATQAAARAPGFAETPATTNSAVYWPPGELLFKASKQRAVHFPSSGQRMASDPYYVDVANLCYLRLLPTRNLAEELGIAELSKITDARTLQLLTHQDDPGRAAHNEFGTLVFETTRDGSRVIATTQLFRNGEIWAISSAPFIDDMGTITVAVEFLQRSLNEALRNFVQIAAQLGVAVPIMIELGLVGLNDAVLTLPRQTSQWKGKTSEPIHQPECKTRCVLNTTDVQSQQKVVSEFIKKLYDLAKITV